MNYIDFGDEWDDNGPNTVSDATITASGNTPNWTTNFTDISIDSFTKKSGPSLSENFDVSMATA